MAGNAGEQHLDQQAAPHGRHPQRRAPAAPLGASARWLDDDDEPWAFSCARSGGARGARRSAPPRRPADEDERAERPERRRSARR